MEEIQTYYQIPSIAHFCNLFRDSLNLPDFDYEDLEFAFLSKLSRDDPELGFNENNLILRLICALLKGYFGTHINHTNWENYLQKLFQIQTTKCLAFDKKRSPFVGYDPNGEEISLKFDDLPLRVKVDVIHCLCEFRLFADDVSQLIPDTTDADDYRVEPLGTDSKGYLYWYFYGTRLYRENPTTAQNIDLNYKKFDESVAKRAEDIKRNAELERIKAEKQALIDEKRKNSEPKKTKSLPPKVLGWRTGLRQRKSDQTLPNGDCSSPAITPSAEPIKCENNSKDKEPVEPSVSLSRRSEAWNLICTSEQEWKDLTLKFEKSKNKSEIEFYKLLSENFVPKISEIFERQERDRTKVERQKLLELLPRRLSSRIEKKKIQKEKEDIIEQEKDRRQQEVEERKTRETDRQRSERIKDEREKRAQKRLQLVEERATRALKRERMENGLNDSSDNSEQFMDTNVPNLQYINEDFTDIPVCSANTVESLYEGLTKVINNVKSNRDAWPFAEAVERDKFPMYYQVIETPIDLSIIEHKIENRFYETFEEVENDFKLMVNNCETFNGPKNGYTLMAYGVWRAFKKSSLKYLERELSYDESNAFIYPQKPFNTNLKPAIEAKKKKMRNKRRSTFRALNVLAEAAEKAVEANECRLSRSNASTVSSSMDSTLSSESDLRVDTNSSVATNALQIHGDMWANFLFNANYNTTTPTTNQPNHEITFNTSNTSTHENLTFKSLDEWSESIKQSGNYVVLPQHAVIISSPQFTHCTNGPVVKPEISLRVVTTSGEDTQTNPNLANPSISPNTFTSSVISNNENASKELIKADPKRLVIKLSRCESGQVWRPVTFITTSPQKNFTTNSVNSNQTNSSTFQPFQGLRNIPTNCVPVKKRLLMPDYNSKPIADQKFVINTGLTANPSNPMPQSFQITGIEQNQNSNLKVFRLKKLDQSSPHYSTNGLPTNESPVISKPVVMPLEEVSHHSDQ